MAFGSMLSKTWRVYKIFTSTSGLKKGITDRDLFMVVLSLVAVNLIIIIVWAVLAPFYIVVVESSRVESDDLITVVKVELCQSDLGMVFGGVLIVFQGTGQIHLPLFIYPIAVQWS